MKKERKILWAFVFFILGAFTVIFGLAMTEIHLELSTLIIILGFIPIFIGLVLFGKISK